MTAARWQIGLGFAVVFLLGAGGSAWVGEDALISFRVIENLADGHGLRWNVDERVQVYTHPLWLLLNAAAYLLTREIFWTTTVLGLACSLAAAGVTVRQVTVRSLGPGLVVLVAWLLSTSLRRYSTSGFESPLTLLLLSLFAARLLTWRRDAPPPWLSLGLLAGLAGTNRLDTLLVLAPALAWLCATERARLRPLHLVLGFTPLALWFVFSGVYYGFLLPNTALAKLSAAGPRAAVLWHGTLYALDLAQRDPVSVVLLLAGAGVTLQALWSARLGRVGDLSARLAVLGLGGLLYAFYVWFIGGGFLTGRFYVAPIWIAVLLCAARAEAFAVWWLGLASPRRLGLAAALLGGLVAITALGALTAGWTAQSKLIALPLARADLGLDLRWHVTGTAEEFRARGLEARRRAVRGERVSIQAAIGFTGLAAGPNALIVDPFALSDPLLARLPPEPGQKFLAGHLRRRIPLGYLEARQTGSPAPLPPELREFYRQLRVVTSGPLFSRERLRAILAFQLGLRPPS